MEVYIDSRTLFDGIRNVMNCIFSWLVDTNYKLDSNVAYSVWSSSVVPVFICIFPSIKDIYLGQDCLPVPKDERHQNAGQLAMQHLHLPKHPESTERHSTLFLCRMISFSTYLYRWWQQLEIYGTFIIWWSLLSKTVWGDSQSEDLFALQWFNIFKSRLHNTVSAVIYYFSA